MQRGVGDEDLKQYLKLQQFKISDFLTHETDRAENRNFLFLSSFIVLLVMRMFVNTRKLLQATIKANKTGHFMWIGSDSWGAKVHPVRDQEYAAEGAITILPFRNSLEGEVGHNSIRCLPLYERFDLNYDRSCNYDKLIPLKNNSAMILKLRRNTQSQLEMLEDTPSSEGVYELVEKLLSLTEL
ncbi:hypothetical protein QAD02_018199 [Eretmocerus hayati]|uniref:Uncharacterized protein n=1 Tax=Eretmocerus hayati TaxID=131215 RepID=A0ACC2PJ29_9HYME|nr:hypothetical protein QAD02_018199 [Eretmocerus hayati]